MSGGHFEYQQYRLHDMAEEIQEILSSEDEYYDYSDETVAEFRKAIRYLQLAETFVQRIDWLVSGDDSEECFHRRLKEELAEIGEENESG